MTYRRADFGLLRKTGYGIGVHWTSRTQSRRGPVQPFEQAVDAFDVPAFVAQVLATGAGHVLFTANHTDMYLPCPNPELDAVLSGRTCRRDLIMELADSLAQAGVALILYYNHGICGTDPQWTNACGYQRQDHRRFYDTWASIVGWMGRRYGSKFIAWWFDGGKTYRCWGADAWPQMAAVAKEGFPDRLICYNSALEATASLTDCQDFWAGEIARINYVPRGPATPAGLPWYAFVDWHAHHDRMWAGVWGLWQSEWLDLDWPAPSPRTLAEFHRRFETCGGTTTFNLLIDQEGRIIPEDLAAMADVRRILRDSGPASRQDWKGNTL
jgi:hypothetical protein